MKTAKVIGLIALIFLAGFTGGFVAAHVFVRRMAMVAINHPGLIRTNFEESIDSRLYHRLGLNPGQRSEVRRILKDSRDRMHALREEFQPQFNSNSLETRTNIYSVLKPDQQERFATFLEENRQFLPVRELPPSRQLEKTNDVRAPLSAP